MSSYFRQVPNFEYVSRDVDQRQISEYAPVKNLFRRGKLREDIFGNLSFFTKYSIIGDERPDNVAFKFYGDENLDWVVLISNNILNIQTEWPLEQNTFDNILLEKYGSFENLNAVKYYKTKEVKDSLGVTIIPAGIIFADTKWKSGNGFINAIKKPVFTFTRFNENTFNFLFNLDPFPSNISESDKVTLTGFKNPIMNGEFTISNIIRNADNNITQFHVNFGTAIEDFFLEDSEFAEFITSKQLETSNNYYYEYYDAGTQRLVFINYTNFLEPVTNLDYEMELENKKRNIFVLKPRYLNIVFNDLEEIMTYKKGSSQYLSRTLKRADNIRLYD
jgi:hypothetical protein